MSSSFSIYSLLSALVKAEEMPGVGPNRSSQGSNSFQARVIDYLDLYRGDLAQLDGLMEAIASRDVEAVNAFLRERGFDIQLRSIRDPNGFATAAVLDLPVMWKVKGDPTTVLLPDTAVYKPAVWMRKEGVTVAVQGDYHFVVLPTKDPRHDVVLMPLSSSPSGPLGIMDAALEVMAATQSWHRSPDFTSAVFPMAVVHNEPDISEIVDMQTVGTDGLPVIVAEALQENSLTIGPKGARARSATAVSFARGAGPAVEEPDVPFVINGPYLAVFFCEGAGLPVFAAHVTPEDMVAPPDEED